MTKEEIALLGKIVLACKGALGMQAGLLPTLKDECFRQIDDLDAALSVVKDIANAALRGGEAVRSNGVVGTPKGD